MPALVNNDTHRLFRRSVAASLMLHAFLGFGVFATTYMRETPSAVTVQQIDDVSIVPLSALETQLQRTSNTQAEDAQRASMKLIGDYSAQALNIDTFKKVAVDRLLPKAAPKSPSQNKRESLTPRSAAQNDPAAQEVGATANGQSLMTEQARINYQDAVATLLSRAKRYPERALKRRITGQATIKIEINADGSLASVAIVRSTESEILDDEVRAMVDRASPFPAFPVNLKKQSITLVVPIAFTLG